MSANCSPKFFLKTFGCKTNQYEGEAIRELLLSEGFYESAENQADIFILNACSVTSKAEKEWLKYAKKVKSDHKEVFMVLTGCYPPPPDLELFNLVVGFGRRKELPQLLLNKAHGHKKSDLRYFEELKVNNHKGHTRAFLKIQEGCDLLCSYCIVPLLRGSRIRSRPIPSVFEELINLLEQGFYEVVLTGIHLGSYGKDIDSNLSNLLEELLSLPKPFRLRISSIEPQEVDERLLKIIKSDERVARHLHLPLQSGSSKILQAMGRPYNQEEYLQKIGEIRTLFPEIGISTDLMIGFPGETEEDFLESIKVLENVDFVKVHLFPFSPRPHTVASRLSGVEAKVVKERMTRAADAAKASFTSYAYQMLGKTLSVLAERKNGEYLTGYSSEYLKVKFLTKNNPKVLYPVLIKQLKGECLIGEELQSNHP